MTTITRPTSIEQVRERLSLLKLSLARYDELTEQMVQSRWTYEMLTREPKLGVNPRGGPTMTAATKLAEVQHGEAERTHARDVLLALTGADTVDVARERYMRLHSSFQRYAQLLELLQLLILEVPAAYGEVEKVTGQHVADYDVLTQADKDKAQQVVQDLMDQAHGELREHAMMPIPALTDFPTEHFIADASMAVVEDAD